MLDAKLLYVGCTRCLHELWLLYSEEASPLLDIQDEDIVSTQFPQ
jgi:DNA helicase-2/ATP-dependent DNA helicase PcrA